MPQLRLKHILGAMFWFVIALAVFNVAVQKMWEIQSLSPESDNWEEHELWPRVPTFLIIPLSMAAAATLLGGVRTGLLLGVPAAIYAGYCCWATL